YYLIGVRDRSPGLVLEDLEFLANPNANGIGLQYLRGERTDAPVLVRGCVFGGLLMGIRMSGISDTGQQVPCGRIRVQNNHIKNCPSGIVVLGAVQELHVVGNRIEGSRDIGVALAYALKETRDILIANNTFVENVRGFQLFDDLRKKERGERIA